MVILHCKLNFGDHRDSFRNIKKKQLLIGSVSPTSQKLGWYDFSQLEHLKSM